MTAVAHELAEWRRQANRSRFADAALEGAFHDERIAGAATRSRVLLGAGMLAAGAVGYSEAMAAVSSPEFLQRNLELRFFGIIPAWLVLLLSIGWPGHRQRADWVNCVGTIVACWALALIYWHIGMTYPRAEIGNAATGGLLTVLLVTAVALPMGFRSLAVAVVGAIGGTLLFYRVTLPSARVPEVFLMVFTFAGIGSVVLFLSWYREAADRLMFAQREYVNRLNAELARLNAEKSEFIAIASHDLRSPLSAVAGLADQLSAGRLAAPAEAHTAIRELAGRMLRLVEDYLGAHAIDHGAVPMELTRLDVSAVVHGSAARARVLAEAKGLTIRVDAEVPVWARADGRLLAQVVENFLSNALKFSPRGTVVQVRVLEAEDGSAVRVEVMDEGPGIAPENQSKLFRKFGRLGTPATGGETSHGLGLAVTKRLAEAMGGEVGCTSTLAAGATFWITLPAARAENAPEVIV